MNYLIILLIFFLICICSYISSSGVIASYFYLNPTAFPFFKKVGASCSIDLQCNNGACGRPNADTNNLVCCPSGNTTSYWGYDYCTGMANGTSCWLDTMCQSGSCKGNLYGAEKGTCG